MRLEGKRTIVTGGASGIGRAIATRFAAEGAVVGLADVDGGAARRTADEIAAAGGRVTAITTNVTDPDRVLAMVAEAESVAGGTDVLVNNAARGPADDLVGMTLAQWDDDVQMTLRSNFLCTQAVLGGMLERGNGVIVNIASVNGLGFYGQEAYSAAKAGVMSLTRSVAVRYGNRGIRANAIAPGTIRTPIWDARLAVEPRTLDKVAAWYPAQRVGTPEDVANAALFLGSDEAAWITGVVLPVDGGLTAGSYRMTEDLLPDTDS